LFKARRDAATDTALRRWPHNAAPGSNGT